MLGQFPAAEGRCEAQTIKIAGGGPAANAAVTLAKQGIPAAVVGVVGNDNQGHQALADLKRYGVDVSAVIIDPEQATQTSCILVDQTKSTRSIITTALPPLPELSSPAKELISAAQWVHTDHRGYQATVDFLAELKNKPFLSLDSGNAAIPNLDLSQIDLYVPTVESLIQWAASRQDAEETPTTEQHLAKDRLQMASAAAQVALSEGVHAVVATDGDRGSYAWWDRSGAQYAANDPNDQFKEPSTCTSGLQVPAFNGAKICSTLGAGDVFHGALLAALICGFSWTEALKQANATAAISCEGIDGRESVPTRAQLEVRLNSFDQKGS